MNIHAAYWKGLGFCGEDLKHSRNNIEAGVRLLESIQERVSAPTGDVIAGVYNELGVGIVPTTVHPSQSSIVKSRG